MTRADLAGILKIWQRRMQLEHWRIEIKWTEPAAEGAHATITTNPHSKSAELRLQPEWEEWNVRQANETLVHELLHCSHRDVDAVIWSMIEPHVSPSIDRTLNDAYDHAMECFVEDMSRILVRGFNVAGPAEEREITCLE